MSQASDIQGLVASTAIAKGIDPQLALAQAHAESSFNSNAVSSRGAMGVMQLMPGTAAQLGVTDPMDPTQNVNGGLTYMQQLLQQFNGDEASALAAYNWGPGNVQRAQASYGSDWLSHAPTATQNYVASILGAVSATAPVSVSADAQDSSGMMTPTDDSTFSVAGLLPDVSSTGPSALEIGIGVAVAVAGYFLADL